MLYFVHKYQIRLEYGGPEEGGWWYEKGWPAKGWRSPSFTNEEEAYETCRRFNAGEKVRVKEEEDYEVTSVLAYRSRHYTYTVSDSPVMEEYPQSRPHYE